MNQKLTLEKVSFLDELFYSESSVIIMSRRDFYEPKNNF